MAVSFVKQPAVAELHTVGATIPITVPLAGVALGNRLVLVFGSNNNQIGTDGAATAADSRGNTYVVDQDVPATGARRLIILSALITTALVNADTVTVTMPVTCGHRTLQSIELAGVGPADRSASTNGLSTSPNSGVTPLRSTANSILIGGCCWNGAAAGETFTQSAGFTKILENGGGAASNWRYVGTEYQVMSVAGTDAAAGTTPNANWSMAAVAYPDLTQLGGIPLLLQRNQSASH